MSTRPITWSGVANILVTPFTPDERIDIDGVRSVTAWAIDAGADAVVPLGIMGEVHKLTDAERDVVLTAVVAEAAGRVPVIAGCTSEATTVVLARAHRAQEIGADAIMVAPPRAATTPVAQRAHYEAVADGSALPIMVQDEPVTTGVKMTSATIGAMGEHANIQAVKVEEVPSPTKVSGLREANPNLATYGGLGGLYLLEELDRGADGIMTGFGYPEVLVRIHRAYAAGDRETARDVFFRYLPLIRYEAQLGIGGVAIRKQLLAERGVISHSTTRLPTPPSDPRSLAELRDLITTLAPSSV